MGIPRLFGWLSGKYKSDIICQINGEPKHLFFDFNGLIYQCYARLDYQTMLKKTIQGRQTELIREVIRYTKHIIGFVKPTISVGFFIDGPVPMAKMHQQRLRRYKSPIFREWENDIKHRYGLFQEELLDTNQITPGTPFMNSLATALKTAIHSKYFGMIDVIFSDANDAGEGEHKIMNYIRASYTSVNDKICIYGMDADLIMLSLSLKQKDVWLIRENVIIKGKRGGGRSGPEFLYVSIERLADMIKKEMITAINGKANFDVDRLIQDYVFIGFLLGNDFLHCIPSINIQHNGIDFLIGLYGNCFAKIKSHLLYKENERTMINHRFLREIFETLGRSEESNLRFLQKRKQVPKTPNFDDHYSEDRWKWDRVPYNSQFEKCFSVVNYQNSGWKSAYYNVLFDGKYDNDVVCKNYFDGLTFVVQYYFDGNVSWNWYNPHHYCPLASDLSQYLRRIPDINRIVLDKGIPFNPFEQLMMVLPKGSSHILPECLQIEMKSDELSQFYPNSFEWVAWERFMLYEINPDLPLIDINKIKEVVLRNKSILDSQSSEREKVVKEISNVGDLS
jgi:5'-3' exonuclease